MFILMPTNYGKAYSASIYSNLVLKETVVAAKGSAASSK